MTNLNNYSLINKSMSLEDGTPTQHDEVDEVDEVEETESESDEKE